MKINKIAIKFGDNDFYNTLRPLLEIIKISQTWKHYRNEIELDKTRLCWIINNLSPIIYIMFQNFWEYNGLDKIEIKDTSKSSEFKRIQKYLQITEDQLLINNEVDEYIQSLKDGWDNQETHILDMVNIEPIIYSV